MAIDAKSHRLFIGCHNKMMVVVNAETGKVVDHQPIGQGVDAGTFDPETGLVYFSCGDGTVTVIHEDGPDKYAVVETVKTKERSRTMALDPKTHDIFLPSADFKPSSRRRTAVGRAGDVRGPALQQGMKVSRSPASRRGAQGRTRSPSGRG